MARQKVEKSGIPYNTDELDSTRQMMDRPERFRMGEIGYSGLNIFNGVSKDELKKELTWPHSVKTFKNMTYHSAVSAPLSLYDNIIGKASFKFIPPHNPTEEELDQTRIMNEMLHDMDQPFEDLIKDAMSSLVYGFSVHEKVFRKRLKSNGSDYDDGVIAWKKIAIRNQESIEKFIFSDDGNEILGVKQNLNMINDTYNRFSKRTEKEVIIPRSKFILFRHGKHRGDPFGKSMLRDCYLSWRYLTALEEIEASGVVKDLNGLPVLSIPAQYMAPDASPEQKAMYEMFKNIIRNIQNNQQSGLILPSAVDPETRQKLFNFELVSTDGRKNYNISEIKKYYQTLIFIAMSADVLLTGNTGGGSFALAESKYTITGAAAESILREIVKVINHDLVKQTYLLNGWNPARSAVLDYDNIQDDSLDELGKFIQRVGAVGFLPKTVAVVNRALAASGIDTLSNDMTREELEDLLPQKTSRSGDGMREGLGSGTGNADGSSGNGSDTNAENAS